MKQIYYSKDEYPAWCATDVVSLIRADQEAKTQQQEYERIQRAKEQAEKVWGIKDNERFREFLDEAVRDIFDRSNVFEAVFGNNASNT